MGLEGVWGEVRLVGQRLRRPCLRAHDAPLKAKTPASCAGFEFMGAEGFEQPSKTPEKPRVLPDRGTESGTLSANSGFTEAVAAVMYLPLTDAEKAEALRRLLAERSAR